LFAITSNERILPFLDIRWSYGSGRERLSTEPDSESGLPGWGGYRSQRLRFLVHGRYAFVEELYVSAGD
jgi:hypothetical protein